MLLSRTQRSRNLMIIGSNTGIGVYLNRFLYRQWKDRRRVVIDILGDNVYEVLVSLFFVANGDQLLGALYVSFVFCRVCVGVAYL